MPFIHPLSFICGDVILKPRASIWPYVVIRGDTERIEIGEDSNIQDGTIVHADAGFPTIIGDRVGVGHRAIIHGAIVEPDSLVGMGAILLNGCRIGRESIVAAGTLLPEGTVVPPRSLVMGSPGRVKRALADAEIAFIRESADNYVRYRLDYL